jgi:hypothetical protein
MGCNCKSNSNQKRVTQVNKRTNSIPMTHSLNNENTRSPRKQIIIRRPAK